MSVTAPTRSSERPTRRQPFLTAETTSDATLVGLAARGDERAFELLFQRHRTDVLAYATRMLRDHGRAEDVVQDVFVSAMRAIVGADRATQPVHVRAWLREIARRACIDQWRGATRRGEVSLDAPDRLRAADAHRLADDDSLARTTDGREAVATLRLAFGDLPELQHAVLVQRELEGRSIAEIADRLETTPTIVEGQLSRGRRALGQAYKELESGQRCVAVRALCDVSIEGRLGVRDRHRVGHHVQGCDGCRRYARAAGVDARLIDRSVLQRASFLLPLPLPLLRRLPVEHVIAGEAAGGALGAKILVGAAVIAAGGGGVYARSVVVPAHTPDPVAPETSVVDDGIARFGMRTGADGTSLLRLPGLGAAPFSGMLPAPGDTADRGTAVAPWLRGSALTDPVPAITGPPGSETTDAHEAAEPTAPVVAPADAGASGAPTTLGTTPARGGTPARSVPLTPTSPTHASSDDGPASPTDDTPESAGGTSAPSTGDTPSDDTPITAVVPVAVPAPAEPTAPVVSETPAEPTAPVVSETPAESAAPPAETPAATAPAPASPGESVAAPAASDTGAGVGD